MKLRRMTMRFAVVLIALQSMVARSSEVDIDVDAAQRAYNAQLAIRDSAQSTYNAAVQAIQPYVDALNSAQSQYNTAQNRVNSAAADLANLNDQISKLQTQIAGYQAQDQNLRNAAVSLRRDLAVYNDTLANQNRSYQDNDRQIDQLQREITREQNNAPWTCTWVNHGREDHRNGHPSTNGNREQANSAAEAACKAVHEACDLRGCDRTSAKLTQLQQSLVNAQNTRTQLTNDINNTQGQIRDVQYRLDQNQNDQYTNQQNLSNVQSQLTSVQNQRDSAQNAYNNAVNLRDYASGQLSQAQTAYNSQRPYVDSAKRTLDSENATLTQRYNYYVQVQKNYNTERDAAGSLGQSSGVRDGAKEGQERSSSVAADDGQRIGADAGKAKGLIDAAQRSFVRGYAVGRASGATLPEVASQYQAGLKKGRDQADRKATLEDLPTGFNDAFAKKLTEVPANSATIDITEQLPTDPGSNGADLRHLHRDVGALPAPAFGMPTEPVAVVPAPTAPAVRIPAQDNRYSKQPCDGLRKPEFVTLCKQSYTSSYVQGYQSGYKSNYESIFASSFTKSATPTYNEAFAQDNPAETTRGKGIGAEHLGILTGFADRLGSAKNEQYAVGVAQLANELTTGHLVVFRSVNLDETSGDGLLQPGEKATLSLVVDNLGQLASPLEKLRLRVTNTVNAKTLAVNLRALPALAGATRTTLKGVLSVESSALFAGDDVAIEAVLEMQKDDGPYDEVAKFVGKQTSHFPVELVAIEQAAALPVSKWTAVSVKIKNLTANEMTDLKLQLSSKPKDVDVHNPQGIPVAKLAAGETKTFDISMNPSIAVGDAPVTFSLETVGAEGKILMDQRFRKVLNVSRSAKLTLLDASSKPVDGKPLVVKAGQSISFRTRFDFLGASQRGPFKIRYANTSDPAIKPSNNSTIGATLGYAYPGYKTDPIVFRFDVASSQAGKTGWIGIELDEGGGAIHRLQVPLDIR